MTPSNAFPALRTEAFAPLTAASVASAATVSVTIKPHREGERVLPLVLRPISVGFPRRRVDGGPEVALEGALESAEALRLGERVLGGVLVDGCGVELCRSWTRGTSRVSGGSTRRSPVYIPRRTKARKSKPVPEVYAERQRRDSGA